MYIYAKVASKIDFFDDENQRKLEVSRNNILKYIGAGKPLVKAPTISLKRRNKSMSPSLHHLVNKFIVKKEEKEEEEERLISICDKNKVIYD